MDAGANAETSLREDLETSLKEIEAREGIDTVDTPATPDAAIDNTVAVQADDDAARQDGRDANGRFVAKAKDAADEDAPQVEASQGAASEDAPTLGNETQQSALADAPPQSWRADEAKSWAEIPANAKSAIIRREEAVAKMVGAQDSERSFGREIADVFRPHMDVIQQFGVSPQFALKALLDNDRTLRTGAPEQKAALARRMMAEYGVDPALLMKPDPNIPSDPAVSALQQRINQLEAQLNKPADQQFSPLPPAQEEVRLEQEIEAFRSDPAHPHFDAVSTTMGRLLETGSATDLSDAYHMAVASNPALRSTAPAPQRTQQDKTIAARRASASVSGSPGATGQAAPTSLRDELREQLRANGFSL